MIAQPKDYPVILAIWRASVNHTHDFVRREDLAEIEKEIPHYLPHLKVALWYSDEGELVGFSGMQDRQLEMLFLKTEKRGQGFGSKILKRLTERDNLETTDVNKANQAALQFYLKNGFQIVGESPLDGEGRPYPLLHLAKK
ncbi:GNAT family N-acetyltransferase [Listeria costaricensis]|uniref:GNAT family N-acetyltransferase n=1 Tax=Listeria costaricensis TaxID=2026604 RepID=UPI001F08B0A5|nr:GNAT family N-acetyltransferase [Listeria costaricensis]